MPHVPPLCGKLVHGAARHSQDTAIGPNGISPEGHPHRARLVQKDEFYFSSPFFILTTNSEVSRQGAFNGVYIFKFGACLAHLTHLTVSWIWGTSRIPRCQVRTNALALAPALTRYEICHMANKYRSETHVRLLIAP